MAISVSTVGLCNFSSARGVDNFKLPTPSPHSTNKEVPEFSRPRPSIPVQALPFGLFTVHGEFSVDGGRGGLTMAL